MNSYSEHGLNVREENIGLPDDEIDIELLKEIADRLNPIAMRIQ